MPDLNFRGRRDPSRSMLLLGYQRRRRLVAPAVAASLSTGLDLPGTSGNFLSVPDSADLDITGDLALMGDVALDDWTPTGGSVIVQKFDTAIDRSWVLVITATGIPRLTLSQTGSANIVTSADSAPVVSDGSALCVGATYRASDQRVQFWTAPSGTTTHPGGAGWSQVGADKTSTATAIYAGTTRVTVGGDSASFINGVVKRVRVWASLDGSDERLDVNLVGVTVNGTRDPSTVTDAAKAATVTINGSGWDWTTS